MPTSTVLSLMDFTAYELPTGKWMKMVRPRMRLRVRVQDRDFVSTAIKVGNLGPDHKGVCWHWGDDGAQFSRPSLADDDIFEVEVERRYLLWYRVILRTKPVTIDQVRTGDHCALSLYDGEQFGHMLEDRIEMGEITFTLRNDAAGDDESSEDKAGPTTYA